jgi:hypothetical protein
MDQREIDRLVEYMVSLTGCEVPTKTQQIPPKHYFSTAVLYFQEIKNGKVERPKEIDSEEKLNDCIKNSMIKYALYEKGVQDLIQQGFTPVIDMNENFWVKGWNCLEEPPKK